jgi:hypothetical protein
MLAAIAGLLLLLAGASRRVLPLPGRGLPLPRRGVVELPREIWMVAAVLMLAVLAGLATVLLIQAVLL